MALVIPGVEITVVKDVVPQQLAPSGVLGIVGLVERGGSAVGRASSWNQFCETFGRGTANSIPEARLALDNGVYQLVVAPISSTHSRATAACAVLPREAKGRGAFRLLARAAGTWANGLKTRVVMRRKGGNGAGQPTSFDIEIDRPFDKPECFRQLTAVPGDTSYIVDVLAALSTVATAQADLVLNVVKESVTIKLSADPNDPNSAFTVLRSSKGNAVASLVPRVPGAELKVTMNAGKEKVNEMKLEVKNQGASEFAPLGTPIDLSQLVLPGAESKIIRALRERLDEAKNQQEGTEKSSFFELVVDAPDWPDDCEIPFSGGKDASADEYKTALMALENEPDVDMVIAAVQDFSKIEDVTAIYSDVISHCVTMSARCHGRLGFGQVPPMAAAPQDVRANAVRANVEMAGDLRSDRFVIVAPHGVLGAVAGMIGGLPCHHSPTFKRLSGLGRLATRLNVDEQAELLKGAVVPVAKQPSKGLVVLRGLTTDGDQINVRRVADRAVRGVKMIGDLFIGSLNTEDGRSALHQKIHEFLLQMEKNQALVPSTDGTDPAFKVNVYSSQDDFALGIVRVDVAVRPVRAIDYIYATILIQT